MRPTPFTVAIVGATGYSGQVLHALMMQHPCITPVLAPGRTPGDCTDAQLRDLVDADAICLALPREPAVAWTRALRAVHSSVRILDLSDAKRLEAHYGLPELFGAPPDDATLVANPGCYPTATLLVLRPLLDAGLIDPTSIAVVGASGATGAGKGLADHLHFCNLADNVFPYKVGRHRHQPEIQHHLGHDAQVSFVTQLLPVARGLQVTAFVRPLDGATPPDLVKTLEAKYRARRWVTVLDEPGQGLGLRHVVGTHQAVLGVGPKIDGGQLPVFASIDNLMRGAASQALHNLNLWLGLDAELGLPAPMPAPRGIPHAFAQQSQAAGI